MAQQARRVLILGDGAWLGPALEAQGFAVNRESSLGEIAGDVPDAVITMASDREVLVAVGSRLIEGLETGMRGVVISVLDTKGVRDEVSLSAFGLPVQLTARDLAPRVRVNAVAADLSSGSDAESRTEIVRALVYLLDARAVTGQMLVIG